MTVGYPPPLVGPTPELGYQWWPSLFPPDPHRCPLVPLVGACCSGCEAGGGCQGQEELDNIAHHVGETAIPWEDVEASNATIMHVQEAAAALSTAPAGSPEAQRYVLWSLFYTTWSIWYGSAKAQVDADWLTTGLMFGNKVLHGAMADTYKSLILDFNQQLKALEALKVQASADPVDTRSPAGKAFDATVDGVLAGAGGALGAASTAIMWIAIVGAVGLVAYLAGPPLIARLAR